jgi:hypothetical protein
MMSDDFPVIPFLVLLFFIAIGIFGLGHWRGQQVFKEKAVEMGYAEYNPKTGEWQWIVKETKEE